MAPGRIERRFSENRSQNKKGLIVFVNAGDPDLDTTKRIIRLLDYNQTDVVELCVPFPNSFTDGEVILRSHERAIAGGVVLNDVLEMIADLRKTCKIPIVLLADFSHTVKPMGTENFLKACKDAQVDGTLIHCLPPLLLKAYHEMSFSLELEMILSLYPKTDQKKREEVYRIARGFIYLVSTYGKTGKSKSFSSDIVSHIEKIRSETSSPLAVGFGVKTSADLELLYNTGTDAVIIGSAVTLIIEENLENQEDMLHCINLFIQQLYFRYWFCRSSVKT